MTDPVRCRVCAKGMRLRDDETAGSHRDKSGHPCPGAGLPPHGDPPCPPTCSYVGTIGWPPAPPYGETHASTVVCDSPSHQEHARAWVYGITGHEGVFRSFAEARAEAGQ